ncbi:MAG: chemotaxis protein CheB [Ignavibacteria bacterium]|jgi:two-component system chemotaxis response regulator CheB
MKILVVEDHASSRLLLKKFLRALEYEIDLVADGKEAIELINKNDYEAVLTDWMMPNMSGLELVEEIRRIKTNPPAMLMITALASEDAKQKALDAGVDDYIAKPIRKDDVIRRLRNCIERRSVELSHKEISPGQTLGKKPTLIGVAIAASTGGPPALTKIFNEIEISPNAAYFVVLHGPPWMLESFADRIRKDTNYPVFLAYDDQPIKGGEIYISPGEIHMIVDPLKMKIKLVDTPPENYVKPSADPLFKSVANAFGKHSVAVVLTGMGHDACIGAGYISVSGGTVIAQDPRTAIIGSMPKNVIGLNLAKHIVPLNNIAVAIKKIVQQKYSELIKQ